MVTVTVPAGNLNSPVQRATRVACYMVTVKHPAGNPNSPVQRATRVAFYMVTGKVPMLSKLVSY